MRSLRTTAILVACIATGPALASDLASCQITPEQQAELSCLCVAPIATPVAVLDNIKGDVWRTDKVDFTPIESAAWLGVGDKVLFSDNGEAVLSAPNCQHAIGPNSSLVVYQLDEACACAALIEDPKPAAKSAHHHGLIAGAAGLIALKVVIHSISP